MADESAKDSPGEAKLHPGPRPQRNIAEKHKRYMESQLAAKDLLIVAEGGLHPSCNELKVQ